MGILSPHIFQKAVTGGAALPVFRILSMAMDRRKKIIYWQGLVAIWGAAAFFVYSEWNQVTIAVSAVTAHLLWRWLILKKKTKE